MCLVRTHRRARAAAAMARMRGSCDTPSRREAWFKFKVNLKTLSQPAQRPELASLLTTRVEEAERKQQLAVGFRLIRHLQVRVRHLVVGRLEVRLEACAARTPFTHATRRWLHGDVRPRRRHRRNFKLKS